MQGLDKAESTTSESTSPWSFTEEEWAGINRDANLSDNVRAQIEECCGAFCKAEDDRVAKPSMSKLKNELRAAMKKAAQARALARRILQAAQSESSLAGDGDHRSSYPGSALDALVQAATSFMLCADKLESALVDLPGPKDGNPGNFMRRLDRILERGTGTKLSQSGIGRYGKCSPVELLRRISKVLTDRCDHYIGVGTIKSVVSDLVQHHCEMLPRGRLEPDWSRPGFPSNIICLIRWSPYGHPAALPAHPIPWPMKNY